MDNEVSLTASIRLDKDRIVADFVVVNRKPVNIYLIDFAMDVGADGPYLRPDHLLVSFDPPDTAVLSSILLPLPGDTSWVTPPTVYSRELPSGVKYKGTASALLPLRVEGAEPRFGENGQPITEDEKMVICRKVRFELGIIVDSPDLEPRRLELAGIEIYELSMAAWEHHQIIDALQEGFEVPLITRRAP